TFYFCAMADSGGDEAVTTAQNGLVIVPLTFSGTTPAWGSPRLVRSVNSASAFIDKPWMCADSSSGTVYVTYTAFDRRGDEIDFQRGPGAAQWTTPQRLSAAADEGLVQGSRVAVGPGGEVYTVWYAIGTDTVSAHPDAFKDFFRTRKSTNQGTAFGTQTDVTGVYANFGTGAPAFNRGNGITFPSPAV